MFTDSATIMVKDNMLKQLKIDFESLQRMIPHSESKYATHYLHRYPAKFLPHFPRIFIKNFLLDNKNGLVLDPMCGSGTTLVESCLADKKCVGIEIDPTGYLIAKVATAPLNINITRKYADRLITKIESGLQYNIHKNIPLPTEQEFPNALLWFREDVLKEIIFIKELIDNSRLKEDYRNFFKLSLSSIIRGISNADPRDIFPQRDKNLLIRERKNVILEFKKSLDKNLACLEDFSRRLNGNHSCRVVHGDARDINLKNNSIDFVFTSPPYAYAMDYARINQLNTLILFMNNKELKEHRKKYVGTDRVSDYFMNNNGNYAGFEFARKAIEDIYSQNKKYGVCLYKYFSDMHKITKEIYRVLKPKSYLVYVVGNSTINRTKFYTDKVFKGICKNVGFEIKATLERPYYTYRLTRKRNYHSNTIKNDIFIIAKKS